jgi:hypothetical protein
MDIRINTGENNILMGGRNINTWAWTRRKELKRECGDQEKMTRKESHNKMAVHVYLSKSELFI